MSTAQKTFAVLLILLFAGGVFLRHYEDHAGPGGSGPLTAVVVEDSAHRTPAIAAVLTAPEVIAAVTKSHVAWHVIDQAETGPDVAEVMFAIEAAQNKQLPVLVLRRGTGKPKTSPLPQTGAALAALLGAGSGG
jgi:hypothetical protein